MNAPIPIGHLAIQSRAAVLDESFIRRVREASLHELRLIRKAHALVGCEKLIMNGHNFGCWRCHLLERAQGK